MVEDGLGPKEARRYNTGELGMPCPGVKPEDCKLMSDGQSSCDGPCKRGPEDANMLYENKLLGVPRLRSDTRRPMCST